MLFHFFAAFLLSFIILIAFNIIFLHKLFAIVMISTVFSLLCALFYILIGASDVALTESSVGAGAVTVLSTLCILATRIRKLNFNYLYAEKHLLTKKQLLSLGLTLAFALINSLIAIANLPLFANIDNISNNNGLYTTYVNDPFYKYQIPNMVTMILGSFRGFDTLLETLVIFAAAIGVAALLRNDHKNV